MSVTPIDAAPIHSTPSDAAGIEVRCVEVAQTYQLDGEDVHALAGVDLVVPAGQALALFGPSGSGKSTLVALLAGLRRQTTGQIWLGEHEISRVSERQLLALRAHLIGVVVQNPSRSLLPYGTAVDNVRFAQSAAERQRRRRLPRPEDLLDGLGLAHLAHQRVGRLSGGEQQRLSIAVAMSCSPKLLLADEPTSQLDASNRDVVVRLLQQVRDRFGTTTVVVTHDADVADALDRRVTLEAGHVVGDTRPSPSGFDERTERS